MNAHPSTFLSLFPISAALCLIKSSKTLLLPVKLIAKELKASILDHVHAQELFVTLIRCVTMEIARADRHVME